LNFFYQQKKKRGANTYELKTVDQKQQLYGTAGKKNGHHLTGG
jgi:hypothetical protein